MGFQAVKKDVLQLLRTNDLPGGIAKIRALPRVSTLKALFSGICHTDEVVRWHAVSAMGIVVADLANHDMEGARVVMRRFMWSLNDESGGIGWGIPEAMAECIACHSGLAREYAHILISYMREDGYYLEYEPLQRGLMWGLGRVARVRPALLHDKQAPRYLLPYLDASDPTVRGLAARALGQLGVEAAMPRLRELAASTHPVRLYEDQALITTTEGELARAALARLAENAAS